MDFEGLLGCILEGFEVYVGWFRGGVWKSEKICKDLDFEGFMHFAIGGKHTGVTYIVRPRGASEPRSGAARYRLRRARAPDSLNLPMFLQAASRGASEPRSGAARYRLRRTRAPDSLNHPIFLQAASRGASEMRSGAARYRPRRSRAPDSVHLPIYCYSSPVRNKTADIRKVQPRMNKNALPVPLPSQVYF